MSLFGDILKALELLLAKVNADQNPEKKRQVAAKELSEIYLNINRVVGRGIAILEAMNRHYPSSLELLTEQLQALDELGDQLTDGSVGKLLDVHMPRAMSALRIALGIKVGDVCVLVDQLVSRGEEVPPEEWTKRLAERMGHRRRVMSLEDGIKRGLFAVDEGEVSACLVGDAWFPILARVVVP